VRNSSLIGRIAAVCAVVIAVVAVVLVVFESGSNYTVTAEFENASQIVSGDLVEVAGTKIGTVSGIQLTSGDQARLTLSISNSGYEPLHRGTQATIREVSLSGIANRYVDLDLGPAGNAKIPNGGVISETNTTSEVDLDELFDTLNAPTRLGLQNLIQGAASAYKGEGKKAQQAFQYLNPAVAASSMLFAQINQDTSKFTRFLTSSGKLVTDIAARQSQLSGLIQNLSQTTGALASQHTALGQSIAKLPGFMTLADTTFTNLRTALTDLTPLVNASKPVAPKLQKLLVQLRPLAQQSVPTLKDLASVISKPGPDNDLIDLTKLGVPLAAVTVNNIKANGATRKGAFPESTIALNDSTPELAFARPYAVDLTGWFEGFSHPGGYDANGAYSRVALDVSLGTLNNGALNLLPAILDPALRSILSFGSDGSGSGGTLVTNYGDRCPGSMEYGAEYYPESGYACTPSEQAAKP
jgi:phospholipid/cholesterol/gamma-HCH transport system substrate-binding protein